MFLACITNGFHVIYCVWMCDAMWSFQEFTSQPDVADDCFLLASRCIRYCPHLLIPTTMLPPLVDCAMTGITIQHRLSSLLLKYCIDSRVMIYSMALFVECWSPMISDWLLCVQSKQSLSTRGACLEVVSEVERRATYFGSFRAKLVLAPLGMPKWVWPSMNRYRMFYVQTSTLPPSMHGKLTEHGRCCISPLFSSLSWLGM